MKSCGGAVAPSAAIGHRLMLFNLILIGLVFGASKKRYNPYIAALIVGVIKGGVYFAVSRNPVVAAAAFLIFTGLAAGMVYLLARVDKKEENEPAYSDYSSKRKGVFRWEYIPLSAVVGLLIFGELLATMAQA